MSASITKAMSSKPLCKALALRAMPRAAPPVVNHTAPPQKGRSTMATISRLYKDYDTGARVVAELEHFGIPHTDISIIANNESGWFDRNRSTRIDRDADGTDDRAEGAAGGAGVWATSGGGGGPCAGAG